MGWYLLCDDGFIDYVVILVCQELGFFYGCVFCCFVDGLLSVLIWMNYILDCFFGNYVEECFYEKICDRRSYVIVLCSYQFIIIVGKNIVQNFFYYLIDD